MFPSSVHRTVLKMATSQYQCEHLTSRPWIINTIPNCPSSEMGNSLEYLVPKSEELLKD